MANTTGFSSNFHAVGRKNAKEAAKDKNRKTTIDRLNQALHRSLAAEFKLFKI